MPRNHTCAIYVAFIHRKRCKAHEIDTRTSRACLKSEMQKRTT